MAALRANTMHARMPTSSSQAKPWGLPCQARTAPISANGKAKSVWLKRIISRIRRTFCHIAVPFAPAIAQHDDRKREPRLTDFRRLTQRLQDAGLDEIGDGEC